MTDLLIYVIAFFVTLPFLATWVTYMIAKQITNHKLKSFHISIHWTTICYILAVFTLSTIYFDQLFSGIIGIILLIGLSLIIIYQWKTNTDIQFVRAIKIMWRFCFLLFGLIYICFIFYGVGAYIIQ